jgi:hypothetical protein
MHRRQVQRGVYQIEYHLVMILIITSFIAAPALPKR